MVGCVLVGFFFSKIKIRINRIKIMIFKVFIVDKNEDGKISVLV